MGQISTVDILTEADAWFFLEKTLANEIPIKTDTFRFNIGSWPTLHIKLEGEKYQSSINTKIMLAFIELQRNIYCAYVKLQYDTANGRFLSSEEKAALELMVEIHQGSSDVKATLTDLVKKFFDGAIDKMEGKHYVILGLGALLAWTSTTAINGYITSVTDHKKIEAQIELSQEETKRLEIMKEASRQVPYVGINNALNDEVVNKILKSASSAEAVTIGGHTLSREQVGQLVRAERSTAQEVRLDGEYRILKVDSSKVNFFKVELVNDHGKRFWAELQDATVTKEKNKELLQTAEWNKTPINLIINGTEIKGEISSARIIDVKDRYLAKK